MTRLLSVAFSALVWVLLWGTFTPLSIVGGVVVGALLSAVFGSAPTGGRPPVRPLRLLGLAGFLLRDLLVSTVEVSWQVLRWGPAARGAIVALPLLTTSGPVVTIMANGFTLSPGTMVLDIGRDEGVWYVYALGPRDQAGVERLRRRAMDLQRRVLAVFGTPDEVAAAQEIEEGSAPS